MSKWLGNGQNAPIEENKVLEITYKQYGKEQAFEDSGLINSYRLHLSTIITGHIISQEDLEKNFDDEAKPFEDEIRSLEEDICNKNDNKNDVIPEKINAKEAILDTKKNKLSELKRKDPEEHLRENGDRVFNRFKFIGISTFLLILTSTILYFYGNVAWVTFTLPDMLTDEQVMNGCSPSVFNSFSEFMGQGPCGTPAGISSIFLPLLFLSFAFVIHLIHSTASSSNIKNNIWVSIVGIFVLLIDLALAVKFEMKVITMTVGDDIFNPLPKGFSDQLFYVINKDNFLLILAFGFFSYVLWAILFHHFEEELKLKDPSILHQKEIRMKNEELKEIELDIDNLQSLLSIIPDEITSLKQRITSLKQKIKIIKIGGINILKKRVNEFTIGWMTYINAKYSGEDLVNETKLINDCKDSSLKTITHEN